MSTNDTHPGGIPDKMGDGGQAIRVVHVERDDALAALVDTYFERTRPAFDVRNVQTVSDAVDAVRETDADCVVTDHRPPTTDARAVVEAVRTVESDLPVVVFAGDTAVEFQEEASTVATVYKRAGLDQLDTLAERIAAAVD